MSGHLSMDSVLKNNRNLLRKKKPYLNSIKKQLKSTEGKIKLKKLSKQKQQLFKQNFIKEQKAYNRKLIYRSLIVIIPVLIFLFYLFNNIYESYNQNFYNKHLQEEKVISNNTLIEKQERYKSTIEYGDVWFEKENWNNAIYFYKKAIEIFPKNFDANYRLALAYSYNCNYNYIGCKKGYKLNNRLLKYFPNNPNLQKLKIFFDKKLEQ